MQGTSETPSNFDWNALLAAADSTVLIVSGSVLLLFLFASIRIFSKAGYHWSMGLLMVVPVVNLVMFLVLAFGSWPVLGEVRSLRRMEKKVESLSSQLPRRAA